jgi:hypothetical protein
MAEPFFRIVIAGNRYEIAGTPLACVGPQTRARQNTHPRWDLRGMVMGGSRLTVRNDRYGCYPVYYFTRRGEVCVSTSIPELLAQGAASRTRRKRNGGFSQTRILRGRRYPVQGDGGRLSDKLHPKIEVASGMRRC